jgi:hypothetical protein
VGCFDGSEIIVAPSMLIDGNTGFLAIMVLA